MSVQANSLILDFIPDYYLQYLDWTRIGYHISVKNFFKSLK